MSKQAWKPGALLAPIPPALVSCGTMDHANIITVAWTGIVNTIVLMLGLADILHQWIVRIVFYGIFVASVLKNILDYMNRKYREESSIQLPSMKTLQGRYNLIIVIIVYVEMHLFYTRDAISYFVFACRREYKQINLKKFLEGAIRYFKYRAFYILKKHGLLAIVLLYGVV